MKKAVKTAGAPAPIGPYNQAVAAGDLIFVSGQIPVDPSTGELILDDIPRATQSVLKAIENILQAAGSSKEKILKATIFLRDMNDFSMVNAEYARFFEGTVFPARETVEVARLPKDVPLEISVIALK